MTPRELAARELLARLEALGVVLWVDSQQRLYEFHDPDLATECRYGYVRGKTCWHVAVVRGRRCGVLEYACDFTRASGMSHVLLLPHYAPGGDLCTRCVRHLVERELATVGPKVSERSDAT
jgi:hypothetical protein